MALPLSIPLSMPLLVAASAAAYSVAMIAMKVWGGDGASVPVVAVVVAAFAIGGVAEFAALRHERLGMIYVLILGAECMIIAAASVWFFNETFTAREAAGVALIVAGTALASV